MQTLEWRSIDKSEWPDGAWQTEPDKRQWVDVATGYACLMVRGPHGGWCGYVGVKEQHPYYQKDYDSCDVSAHGGLTFSDHCHEATAVDYDRAKGQIPYHQSVAKDYPRGDSARWLKEVAPHLETYEQYVDHRQATGICHIADGEDKVWWLGFDCAHAGDFSPAYARLSAGFDRGYNIYRDQKYVEHEVAELARQLKEKE